MKFKFPLPKQRYSLPMYYPFWAKVVGTNRNAPNRRHYFLDNKRSICGSIRQPQLFIQNCDHTKCKQCIRILNTWDDLELFVDLNY